MFRRFLLLFYVLFSCCWAFASTTISVSPMIIDFANSSDQVKDINVYNRGKNPAYVNVSVMNVVNPGTAKEKFQVIKNPEKAGLLASPNKLVIPEGQYKIVRAMLTRPHGKQDRFYTIKIAPVIGPIKSETTAGVKILVAYGVKAIVRPENPLAKVNITRKGKNITLANAGNTNVMLYGGEQCSKNKCKKFPDLRLYAHGKKILTGDFSSPAEFKYDFNNKTTTVSSN